MAERLYLVDGSTYIFRAFHAIRMLTNDAGLPTNAVYGFTGMLLKLVREEEPDYLAVVFDKGERSFRNEIYPDYKAHRPPMPEDLRPQIPYIRSITDALAIPAVEHEDYEADDLIATLTRRAREQGMEVVVVSSDKDLMQVVDELARMFDSMRDKRYGPDEVVDKLGVRPEQVPDYLALLGDSVDNIPGVPGIGEKTAAKLLSAYGSLEGVYEHLDDVKGKRRENLETHYDQAFLSRDLARVRTRVELPWDLGDFARREPDRSRLTELFDELGFKSWQREFHDPQALEDRPRLGREGFRLVVDREELERMVAALREAPCVAFDTETTSLRPRRAELVGLSFAADTERCWYVPVGHTGAEADRQLPRSEVLEALSGVLTDPEVPKAAQNAKYDLQVLRHHGLEVRGLAFDPMLASYLVQPGKYTHSLDNIALDRLNHKTRKCQEVAGSGKEQVTFDRVGLTEACDYACEDAQLVLALREDLEPEVERMGLTALLHELELPLERVLGDMEDTGVRLDAERLHRLSEELGERARALEERCHELAGRPFTLGSPQQIATILFEEIGLKPIKRTKTGYSTDSTVLEELAHEHELPALILQWRQLTKLKSTYTDVLPTLVDPDSGRIHTSYNQAVAATGRLSSTEPNLQNIPVRTPDGRRIREAFVADEGRVLLSADYSQIELRVLAHLAEDEAMKQGFRDGDDIHARTASELFGVPTQDVSREQRAVAKTVNFGILYGMSAHRLSREQDMPRREAKAIIDRYFERYPRIQAWKDEILEEARSRGAVTTLLGRVRPIPDIHSKSHPARRAAERIAINTPVQGSAADIIKKAMVRIHGRLADEDERGAHMVMQVHDELVFEVPEERASELASRITEDMQRVVEMDVPLEVEADWGRNWLEAH